MRKAFLILFLAMGGAAVAQEGQPPSIPPSVTTEAPALGAAPADDGAASSLPDVPATGEAAPALGDSPASGDAAPAATSTDHETATTPGAAPAAGTPDAGAPAAGPTAPVPPHAAVGAAAEGPLAGPASPATLPVHTDLLSIVLEAHWVVLAVMVGLAVAAFATLVILIQKLAEYALAFGKMKKTARVLGRAVSLQEAEAATRGQKGPAAAMVRAASEELSLALGEPELLPGVRERTHASLVRIDAGAAQRLKVGTGALASIGSLSPFVGLFGTVFGIMNSFLAIAESKTTNLAIVAPGIAEALFATAIGLAAAIPAVLIYNICSRKLAKYRHRLADIAAATERLQSRDLDRIAARLAASLAQGA